MLSKEVRLRAKYYTQAGVFMPGHKFMVNSYNPYWDSYWITDKYGMELKSVPAEMLEMTKCKSEQ